MSDFMPGELIRRYAGLPVPRYTSYPTAADFSAAVGSADHAL
jgi:oxygen-independent coproporphyrinogen-3 oxidase